MDIRKQKISINEYPCFKGYQSSIIHDLWISIRISLDFYGYPCIDLLWILDPGILIFVSSQHRVYLTISCLQTLSIT